MREKVVNGGFGKLVKGVMIGCQFGVWKDQGRRTHWSGRKKKVPKMRRKVPKMGRRKGTKDGKKWYQRWEEESRY